MIASEFLLAQEEPPVRTLALRLRGLNLSEHIPCPSSGSVKAEGPILATQVAANAATNHATGFPAQLVLPVPIILMNTLGAQALERLPGAGSRDLPSRSAHGFCSPAQNRTPAKKAGSHSVRNIRVSIFRRGYTQGYYSRVSISQGGRNFKFSNDIYRPRQIA